MSEGPASAAKATAKASGAAKGNPTSKKLSRKGTKKEPKLAPPGPQELIGLLQNVLTIAFWTLVVADHKGYVSVIDPEYKEAGFCVAEHQSNGFNSYQLCFFIDTAACLCLLFFKDASYALGPVCTIFFHGAFHMAQYVFGWPLPPTVGLVAYPVFTLAMVAGFGVGTKVGSKLTCVVVVLAIELFRRAFVPLAFDFAYANTWIYAIATAVGVTSPSRQKQPMAATLLILAGTIVPFLEGILCNRGFKAAGGHALFDLTVALAALAGAVNFPNRGASKQHEQ